MTVVLQIANRAIPAEEILPLLAGYKMLPQFIEELLIDAAIASIECSAAEIEQAREQYYGQNQITEAEARQAWLDRYGMTPAQLEAQATRELRIEKFKQQTWGAKLESYFLGRKAQLDRVIYSLIRTQDVGIAQELYFRVLEGEQSFGELARHYSKGPEAQTEGLIGPVELSVPHPILGQLLASSQPGQVNPPTRVGEWIVLVRLEKFIPAQMDDAMRRRLLNECFDTWLQDQLDQLGSLVPVATSVSAEAAIAPPTAATPTEIDRSSDAMLSSSSSSAPAASNPATSNPTASNPTASDPTASSSLPDHSLPSDSSPSDSSLSDSSLSDSSLSDDSTSDSITSDASTSDTVSPSVAPNVPATTVS